MSDTTSPPAPAPQTATPAAPPEKPKVLFDPEKAAADFSRHIFLKIITTLWFLAVLGVCAYALLATRNELKPYERLGIGSPDTEKQIIYVFLAGIIGAALYAFHGFCVAAGPQKFDNDQWHYDPNWTWWYIASPIIGGFVGLIAYAVVKTGVATLGETSTSSVSNLGYFAVAGLAGLSSKHSLAWLGSKAKNIFPSTTAAPTPSATPPPAAPAVPTAAKTTDAQTGAVEKKVGETQPN